MNPSESQDGGGLRRVAAATGVFVACIVAAAIVAATVGSWGRDLRPPAALAALLLGIAAFRFAGWRGYRVAELLAAWVVAELLFAGTIAWYAGAPHIDRFFMSWFLGGSLYLSVPWLAGATLGARRARRARR